jgi:TATA-box binding protein (TBP) (component of TFIID and TFIIIB)
MKREAEWMAALERMCADVVPLKRRPIPADQQSLPLIVNCVSTTTLLPQWGGRYKLPLAAISLRLGPCAQYAPDLFAALIVKLTDSTRKSTALVFASGKIVVVSGLTLNHTRNVSQMVRYIVEQVQCVTCYVEGGPVNPRGSLVGCTIFQDCHIHNIVGHSYLGHRIDLQKMCDAAPACCKWLPDLFPGLKCKIWLTPEHMCVCLVKKTVAKDDPELCTILGKGSTGQSCVCSVRVLIFDSGKIVITGGHHVRDVNSVFFRIHELAPQFQSRPANSRLPVLREDRFYQRLATMMVPSGTTGKTVKKVDQKQLSSRESIVHVFDSLSSASSSVPSTTSSTKRCPPIIRMALDGRVDELRKWLLIDPSQANTVDDEGRTALMRIKQIPLLERTLQQRQVIELLLVFGD